MSALVSAAYGSKQKATPPDYFEVRVKFAEKLVDDILKNPQYVKFGSSSKMFIEELYLTKGEQARFYEQAFLGGAIEAICKITDIYEEELQFIVKELNRATPHKKNPYAKGLEINFEKFYDSKMEKHITDVFRDNKSKPKVIEEFTTTMLENNKYLDLNGDISPDIKILYRTIVGDEIIRQMKQHTSSSISAMESYVNRKQISSIPPEEKKQQIKRIACFYMNIFGAEDIKPVKSEILKELFKTEGLLTGKNILKKR